MMIITRQLGGTSIQCLVEDSGEILEHAHLHDSQH
jgi:hypothetical protein